LTEFGSRARLESPEQELRIAARHHSDLAKHLRIPLAAGVFEQPDGLLTATGARHLVAIHNQNVATCIALAETVNHALCPPAGKTCG
jgi:hypothetical protein